MKELIHTIPKTTRTTRNDKPKLAFTSAKKLHFVAKSSKDEVDSAISTEIMASRSKKFMQNESITGNDKSTRYAIPPPCSSKNIAEERLHSLQLSLSLNAIDRDSSRVFGSSFGIDNAQHSSVSNNGDEEMDWEPCDDAHYTFQQLESMAVDVLTESSYIIPDTNVFIDSLASIKKIIDKGKFTEYFGY